MVDVELIRTWRDRFSLKAGVQNIFDDYPDPGDFEVCCGRTTGATPSRPGRAR